MHFQMGTSFAFLYAVATELGFSTAHCSAPFLSRNFPFPASLFLFPFQLGALLVVGLGIVPKSLKLVPLTSVAQ